MTGRSARQSRRDELAGGRPRRAGRWWQKLLLVVLGVAAAIVLLVLLEGALALAGWGETHLYEDPFVGFGTSRELFVKQVGQDGRELLATAPGKLSFFNQQQFPLKKAAGTYRIFALGGSTTAGRPYDWKVAFPHMMQLYLDAMQPGRRFEVINAGAISYASYRIVVLMKELVRYEPDLFVVYTGHNEFLEERSYRDIIHQNPLVKSTRLWLSGRRLFAVARLARERLRPRRPEGETTLAGEVETRLDGWTGLDLYERDAELRESIVAHFEYNLRQMVRMARAAGADVIFISPASNLKDFSPFKSQHRSGLTHSERQAFSAAMARGRALLAESRYREALAAYDEARSVDPEFAEVHFRLGRCRLALGDDEGALADFELARDLDVAPLRALGEIVRLVNRVGGELGVSVFDLPGELAADSEKRYGHPILGDEYFQDHVHPTLEVHSLIAERVIDTLVRRGVVQPSASWTPTARQKIYDRLMSSLDRAYYAERDHNLAKVLVWSGKLEEAEAPLLRAAAVLSDNPEVRLNLGILFEKTGRHEEAVAELQQAIALDPGSAEAHFNLGTNYAFLGRLDSAIDSFRQAIRLQGSYPLAYFNLGLVLRQAGDLEAAAAALERAEELRPNAPEVPRNLGTVYARLQQPEKAIAAFRRALELAPSDIAARRELGILYGRLGRVEAASEELRQVLAARPDDAEANFNLGVLLAQQGMTDRAVAAYERALEENPRHARASNNLGILHARAGRLEAARAELERAVEADPDYAEAYLNLAVVYDQTGRADDALSSLRRGLEVDPESVPLNLAIASLYQARGEVDLARRHEERARTP